jgi:starch synthase
MRILFLSSEVAPYSKTGGLADVSGALPARLRGLGEDVHTLTPLYPGIEDRFDLEGAGEVSTRLGGRSFSAGLRHDPATDTWFLDAPDLYHREELYTHDPDEHLRWGAFGAMALAWCEETGWIPDVVHINDWQTGLVPLLLARRHRATMPATSTVLTIHNLGYQGWFGVDAVEDLELEEDETELAGAAVAYLAAGIRTADLVTTVSPTYAREIQTPEGGAGLDGLLRARAGGVIGILNGIDVDEWNPRTDPHIPYHYSERSLWRKEWNKEALCKRLGLDYRRGVPVIGVVTRLVQQKGIDIMRGPLSHFLDTWDLRVVVLGSGERQYEAFFTGLAAINPGRAAFVSGYDIALSHLIEAGSDIFLMPSLYEPCGLNQMYSLAYGTVPVVRRVGGLADTVSPFDPGTKRGTGFVFEHYTDHGLGWAIGRALTTHMDQRVWRRLQQAGMAEDNTWEHRAEEYRDAYRRVVALRRGG